MWAEFCPPTPSCCDEVGALSRTKRCRSERLSGGEGQAEAEARIPAWAGLVTASQLLTLGAVSWLLGLSSPASCCPVQLLFPASLLPQPAEGA